MSLSLMKQADRHSPQLKNTPTRSYPRIGLFWRTFLLVALLLVISFALWLQLFRAVEREPRARQIAQQIVSVVNLTRTALLNSEVQQRGQLLRDLAKQEGVRIYPLESSDIRQRFPDQPLYTKVTQYVSQALKTPTELAEKVNDIEGLWVSMDIEGDPYWVVLPRDRIDLTPSLQWFVWAAIAIVLAGLGAWILGKWLNRPLLNITQAAQGLMRGQLPGALPEAGPHEILLLNRSFNQMVQELQRIDSDRALILAGISHDLRTPITRLRLEIEMAGLDQTTRDAMIGDLAQMEMIVGQFLDYARTSNQQSTDSKPKQTIHLSELVSQICADYQQHTAGSTLAYQLNATIAPHLHCNGYPDELRRALINLIENAIRYGRHSHEEIANIHVTLDQQGQSVTLAVSDLGPGVAPGQREYIKRPFARLDQARTGSGSSGLGLAIVERIALRHQAKLNLQPSQTSEPCGLTVSLLFQRATPELEKSIPH